MLLLGYIPNDVIHHIVTAVNFTESMCCLILLVSHLFSCVLESGLLYQGVRGDHTAKEMYFNWSECKACDSFQTLQCSCLQRELDAFRCSLVL